jgi:hypothetical protein
MSASDAWCHVSFIVGAGFQVFVCSAEYLPGLGVSGRGGFLDASDPSENQSMNTKATVGQSSCPRNTRTDAKETRQTIRSLKGERRDGGEKHSPPPLFAFIRVFRGPSSAGARRTIYPGILFKNQGGAGPISFVT